MQWVLNTSFLNEGVGVITVKGQVPAGVTECRWGGARWPLAAWVAFLGQETGQDLGGTKAPGPTATWNIVFLIQPPVLPFSSSLPSPSLPYI